jgi:hypothetical protein
MELLEEVETRINEWLSSRLWQIGGQLVEERRLASYGQCSLLVDTIHQADVPSDTSQTSQCCPNPT